MPLWRYDIFGKYGAIRQIRVGNTPETRGTAFVIYEDIFDAKNACDHLSGFNVCNRYTELEVTFEFNCCAQVSCGPLLPGKQSFREAGRSKEGSGSAEDEGEIQPEHSCPLTHPDLICTLSSTLALFLKSLNHFSVVFGRFFRVCPNCIWKKMAFFAD